MDQGKLILEYKGKNCILKILESGVKLVPFLIFKAREGENIERKLQQIEYADKKNVFCIVKRKCME